MKLPTTLAAILVVTAMPGHAQWLHQPTAGLPRLPSGAPDLNAAAPRTADGKPDLSGIWMWRLSNQSVNVADLLRPEEIQPAARTAAAQRADDYHRDDPWSFRCLPLGPRLNQYSGLPAKIVQTPTLIVLLSEGLMYRQIFLDGRRLPTAPNPAFMGYSVGRWEGDTLVIESTGFDDTTWLDNAGHPHTEALRIVERVRRPDVGHLEIDETIEDGPLYAKPITVHLAADLMPDTELLEYVCNQNEKDLQHLVGKASDEARTAVEVPVRVLEKYAGTYDLRLPTAPSTPNLLKVSLIDGMLVLNGRKLLPRSTTRFGAVEFVMNDRGEVTHLIFRAGSQDLLARRVPDPR